MITTTYGYKKPQTGDTGDAFFPAIEFDIQRMNDHTHNGVDSAFMLSLGASLAIPDWVPVGSAGMYEQQVYMGGGRLFDTTEIWFRTFDGNRALLDYRKSGANGLIVTTNQPYEQYTVFFR